MSFHVHYRGAAHRRLGSPRHRGLNGYQGISPGYFDGGCAMRSAYGLQIPEPDAELTRVGPGTPCGELLRRYWQPVCRSADLQDLPKRVRLLGEDLVAFRDGQGRPGLMFFRCSHRGTSLEYGRVEERGLRCCYHGWLYDVEGR